MLILTRKVGEAFYIEVEGREPIEVRLLEQGKQCKLGVSAPAEWKVWRSEIYQTVVENRQAAQSALPPILPVAEEPSSRRDPDSV